MNKVIERRLLTSSKKEEKDSKAKKGKDDKQKQQCFHCKDADALPGRGVCQRCSSELEAWRNKKDKKKSEK